MTPGEEKRYRQRLKEYYRKGFEDTINDTFDWLAFSGGSHWAYIIGHFDALGEEMPAGLIGFKEKYFD